MSDYDFSIEKFEYSIVSTVGLEEYPPLSPGQNILCPYCGEAHTVTEGIFTAVDSETGEKGGLLIYKCDETEKIYVAGVNGRNLMARYTPE